MARFAGLVVALFLAACGTTPAPSAPAAPEGITGENASDWLESPNREVRDHALELILADPGAQVPAVFAWVAAEYYARGDLAEAARWSEFGGQRLSEDIAFMTANANEQQREFLAQLPSHYASGAGDAFLEAYRAMPADALWANFERVQEMHRTIPRRYAPNWAIEPPGYGYRTNWSADPGVWTIDDTNRIGAIHIESQATFRNTVQLLINLQEGASTP